MDAERETLGLRDILSAVNVRDFARMVDGELRLLGSSLRLAFGNLPKLPFGPVLFLAGAVMVVIRLTLLAIVIVVFGSAIVIVSGLRALLRLLGRGSAAQ